MTALEASETRAPWDDPCPSIAEAYEAYAGELERYVARGFPGLVVPEDVVHEAFARLVRESSAGREPTMVRAWLYRVAHNLAVDEVRRLGRWERDDGPSWARAGGMPSAEAEFEASSLSPKVRRALGSLSRARRTTILMAADGYTGHEIAAVLGRSELATRVLLCRTRRALRETLANGGRVSDLRDARRQAA